MQRLPADDKTADTFLNHRNQDTLCSVQRTLDQIANRGVPMNADTITAVSAVVIALGSLAVSAVQTRAILLHNRQSVRPLLQLRRSRGYDGTEAGLAVINSGPGPAIITKSVVALDGQIIGPWDRETVRSVTDKLPEWPKINTFDDGAVLGPGYSGYLIHLDSYDREEYTWFWDLISKRLQVTIHYESLYGDEEYVVTKRAAFGTD